MKHHPLLYTLRRNAAAALSSAALVAGLHMTTTPAHAAYKPERKVTLQGEAKSTLKEAVSLLKDLPNQGRQAIIAQRLGLYFSQDGESKYNGSRNPSSGALFVDTTGATLDWNSVKNSMVPVQWREADEKVQYLGTDAVLPSFTKEVTSQIYATAKSIISSMPEVLRDAVLAEEGSLLYSTSGKKAYSSRERTTYTDEGFVQKKRDFAVPSSELRFKDSEGYERSYSKVMSEHEKEWKLRCDIFARCIQYTSRKEILALFPNELSALRKSKASSTTKVAQDTPSAPDSSSGRTAMGDISAPKQATEVKRDTNSTPQVATAMGNTQAPQQPTATPDTPQVTVSLSTSTSGKGASQLPTAPPAVPAPSPSDSPTVAALKKMPMRAREAWLAEWMGLCFMPDKGSSLDERKEAKRGTRYAGSDGKEHDLWEDRQAGGALWSEASQNVGQSTRIGIVRQFPEVVKQMAQHNLRLQYSRLSEFMRDAWLAEIGSCFYLPDGSGSAYTGTLGNSHTESGFRGPWRGFSRDAAKFRDSKGAEHSLGERNPYWDKGEDKSWNIMHACAALLGTKEVAEIVFPQELATLRKHNPEATKFPAPIQTPFLEGEPRLEFEEVPYDHNGEPHPGVEHFKKMNPASQEAWLAEKMGLLFMSDGQGAYDKKEGRAGSLYVGSDGNTHDVLNTLKENDYMRNFLRRYDQETEAIIRSVPETSEKVAFETAKYILLSFPRLMRDAWLCEYSGLCYVPGSTADAYRSDFEDVSTIAGKHVYVKVPNAPIAAFTDTTGAEHPMTDRQPYWKEVGKKWLTLGTCTKYCDRSKIFDAFSAEMATLRKNYTTSTKRPAPASAGSSSSSESDDGNSAMGRRWF